jgi:hypothetical protein
LTLQADAEVVTSQPAGVYSSVVDFRDTGVLSTIHAFDINGNELTDFTVTAESGFDYPTGPLGATPEPGTLLLFGSTMTGLGLAARWRRHRVN